MTQPQPRSYSNTAVNTTLTSAVFGPTATSMTAASNVGYPTTYPFTIRINPGAANEEIVDVTAGLGTLAQPWTVVRGRDGTTAQNWSQGTPLSHGFSARDFADIQAAMVNAQSLISNALPVGTILMWYGAFDSNPGSISNIPQKFKLCDGKSYKVSDGSLVAAGTVGSVTTPNLTNRFIYGAGGTKSPGAVGGNNVMTSTSMPSHTHTVTSDPHTHTVTGGTHDHAILYKTPPAGLVGTGAAFNGPTTAAGSPTSTAFTANGSGSSHTHTVGQTVTTATAVAVGDTAPTENNMPSYYAVAFIMRVAL